MSSGYSANCFRIPSMSSRDGGQFALQVLQCKTKESLFKAASNSSRVKCSVKLWLLGQTVSSFARFFIFLLASIFLFRSFVCTVSSTWNRSVFVRKHRIRSPDDCRLKERISPIRKRPPSPIASTCSPAIPFPAGSWSSRWRAGFLHGPP